MTADQTRIKCGVSPRRGDLFVATVTLLQAIKSPTHHPRIIIFSVTHGAGFVNLFMSESDILDSHRFPSGSGALIRRPNLSPLLRPVVFVGKSPLRPGFDFQRFGMARCRT